MNNQTQDRGQIWFRRFSKLVCFSTLALIFIGGMVSSTNSGLSVPDWPTTYGQNMFTFPVEKWQGGIFYEHGHRLVASAVGFLTLVMAIWIPFVERRDWVRFLGFAALSAVVLQGLLGGLTVLMRLPPAVSILHGVLAQTFFILTILLAYSQSVERRKRAGAGDTAETGPVARAAMVLVGMVYLQLVLGAVMRHTHAGLAVPDFPRMGGSWLPGFGSEALDRVNAMRAAMGFTGVTIGQMYAHLAHRAGALLVLAAVIAVNVLAHQRRNSLQHLRATIFLLDAVLVLQVALGAFTVWSHRSPVVTSLHVVTGASILGLATLLALRASPVRPVATREPAPVGDPVMEAQPA